MGKKKVLVTGAAGCQRIVFASSVNAIPKHEDMWMDVEGAREIGCELEDGTAFPHAG